MSILTDLDGRLAFVRQFYFTAACPFEAILLGCIPHDDPNDEDLRDEFEETQKGLELLGQFCVSLVCKAIIDYLRSFISDKIGPNKVANQKGRSVFEKYETALINYTTFDWLDSPVKRDLIEQINLCRNDFNHDLEIDSSQPRQSEKHFRKHPASVFKDLREHAILKAIAEVDGKKFQDTPASLTVSRQRLISTIAAAGQFCAFVEEQKLKP